jgi:hypothetical protein
VEKARCQGFFRNRPYKRDVGTCVAFLEREGIVTVRDVLPIHLRRFLAEESICRPSSSRQAREPSPR